jgi:hypothetical protein
MLHLFEEVSFKDLAADLNRPELEGLDADNLSLFHKELVNRTVQRANLSNDELKQYDNNIVRHVRTISEHRPEPIQLKYFQYLGLLFAEVFLDRFFTDQNQLLKELNEFIKDFNADKELGAGGRGDAIEPIKAQDLRKLAFWSATGSGKTLLMHINILQYQHYLKTKGKARDLNRIILLTPNEGLSRQHLDEFEQSGIEAEIFSKDGASLFSGKAVEIIEVTKLREVMGDKTVAIEAFEGNNLVLVDEGHRGNKDDGVWRSMRNRLAETGFCFEYSATFSQAVKASGSKVLEQEYAKCILFNYSYKYFYEDGYGKDYRILNLANDADTVYRRKYLTACLLSFYQQLRLYKDRGDEFAKFLLEKPLAVFVGGSVNAVRTEDKKEVSDVTTVLLFLKEFVANAGGSSVELLEGLMTYDASMLDQTGKAVFGHGSFNYLITNGIGPQQAFNDMLALVFNAAFQADLHVELLRGTDGELALRLGDNEPFGVINVGDAPKLLELCSNSGLYTSEKQFSSSVFAKLNDRDSKVNILIGSRKFIEGWSCWRVSTMGLLNLGKSEGSQIIQLFGRGVRLKGLDMSLKRSSKLSLIPKPEKSIRVLETLNVFGVKAEYMAQFDEMLKEEGVSNGSEQDVFVVPVVSTLDPAKKLKVLDVLTEKDAFKKKGPKPKLEPPFEKLRKIELDWYPRIQSRKSKDAASQSDEVNREVNVLSPLHVAFFNIDEVWFELQRFKAERSWYNLILTRDAIIELLNRDDWYTLFIPSSELKPKEFEQVRRWQEIAVALLKKYVEQIYRHRQAEYEQDFLGFRDVTPEEATLSNGYVIDVANQDDEVLVKLKELKNMVEDGTLHDFVWQLDATRSLSAVGFSKHLYKPILSRSKGVSVSITPVPLNTGERDFVDDLRKFCDQNTPFFQDRELYLLRNMSRGKGIGFFAAGNFYPDFILWIVEGDRQFVTFVDPKGIRNLSGLGDAKIAFSATIKELEKKLADSNVVLNSFIVSTTAFKSDGWWAGEDKEVFDSRNVLFQIEDKSTYVKTMLERVTAEPATV